jgi:predicted metal-dependent HD superfamily phosphohydrolase
MDGALPIFIAKNREVRRRISKLLVSNIRSQYGWLIEKLFMAGRKSYSPDLVNK